MLCQSYPKPRAIPLKSADISHVEGVPALLNSLVCSWRRASLVVLTDLSESTQTSDGLLGSDSSRCRQHVRASGDLPVCGLALPDASGLTLDALFAAEGADVFGALGDFELLHDLPCLLYTSPSPRDLSTSRMPSSA